MFGRFKQRSQQLERLDTGDYTPAEYAKWHREMRVIHRVFGEIRALRGTLLRQIRSNGNSTVSILDIGAGSGELLRAIKVRLHGKRALLVGGEIEAKAARAIRRGSLSNEVVAIQCDGHRLPFADDSFDHVICSLVLHHLNDEKAVELLAEMSRVARKRIFVIDLHRSPIAYYFYKNVARLLLQRFTREDGALSILRSFKPDELRQMAEKAGLRDIEVKRSAAYRLVLSGR